MILIMNLHPTLTYSAERGVNVAQYEAHLRQICNVFTVHKFWEAYYNLPQPSSLHFRSRLV